MNFTNEQAQFLRQQHVVLGMPMYGGILHERTFLSLLPFLMTAAQLGMQVSINTLTQSSIIAKARCVITADFLGHPGTTHLMWIDSDMVFDPDHVFRLLLHDKDMIGGLSTTKSFPPSYNADVLPEAVGKNNQGWNTKNGLIPLAHIGTGFLLIKRNVIDKMVEAYPETKFNDHLSTPERNAFMYALWDNGINKHGNYVGEDYMFSDRWRAIGGDIWADPAITVDHIGAFTFSVDQTRLLTSLGAKPDSRGNMALNLAPQIKVHNGGNDLAVIP